MNELDPMFLKYCTHRQLNSVPDYLHVYLHIPHSTAIAQVTLPKHIHECNLTRVYLSILLFCKYLGSIFFPEKVDDQFQKKNACYLSSTHSIKICSNVFHLCFPAFKIQQNLFLTFLTAFHQKQKLRLM